MKQCNTRLIPKALVSALVVAFAATMPGLSFGQTTAGSVAGKAATGSAIVVESKSIGLSRQVVVGSEGNYQVNQLPPGQYTVRIKYPDGSTEDRAITVTAGEGTTVHFTGAKDQQVVVTGRLARIDVKSAESNAIFSRDIIDRVPVQRDVTAVALLAPGVSIGDSRISTVPTLGGASQAENAFYVNGFNVTNMVNGIAFSELPFEAIASQTVKTGGYSAEFGRSLGGVIAVTTKRGTNEWKGGVNLVYTPDAFTGKARRAEKSAVTGQWNLLRRPSAYDDVKANAWIGGPAIQDTLYVFGLIQGAQFKRDTFARDTITEDRNNAPQYVAKVDWNINKDNLLELTMFSDETKTKSSYWKAVRPFDTEKGAKQSDRVATRGGRNEILKYTTWVNEDLTVSALYGQGRYSRKDDLGAGKDCPGVEDARTSQKAWPGCASAWSQQDPNAHNERKAFRLDAEWTLGAHTLRFGMDNEEYKVLQRAIPTGEGSYIVKLLRPNETLENGFRNTTGSAIEYVDFRYFANGGEFKTKNNAFYIEDQYQVSKNVLATIGLRSEGFDNLNLKGESFVKVDKTIAPRLGIAWDVLGDGSMKVYGNAGRYFIPIMSSINVRLSGGEIDYHDYYVFGGGFANDRYQRPILGAKLGDRLWAREGDVADPRSVVDPNLKPMFQDEFIVGAEKALANRWSVGAKLTHRRLRNVMDDVCGGELAQKWALANGYTPAQAKAIYSTVDHCFLYNPGKDLTANVDFGDGNLKPVTIPADALKFPMPKRTYNALELSFSRPWDGKWSLQGSYVLAFSKGNAEGYVKSDTGQLDAGQTTDWDYPGLMEHSYGYLPNDRRHTLKMFGAVQATPEWRVGANLVLQSGRPKNCLDRYAGTLDSQSRGYGQISFYCAGKPSPRGSAGRLPWSRQLNMQAAYTPAWQKGLSFQVDVLNVFDTRIVRSVQESNSSSYGEPLSWQPARSFRFTTQYEF